MLSPGLTTEWILLLFIPGEAQSPFITKSLEQPLLLLEESAMALRRALPGAGPRTAGREEGRLVFCSPARPLGSVLESLVISTNLLPQSSIPCWAKRQPRGNSGSSPGCLWVWTWRPLVLCPGAPRSAHQFWGAPDFIDYAQVSCRCSNPPPPRLTRAAPGSRVRFQVEACGPALPPGPCSWGGSCRFGRVCG